MRFKYISCYCLSLEFTPFLDFTIPQKPLFFNIFFFFYQAARPFPKILCKPLFSLPFSRLFRLFAKQPPGKIQAIILTSLFIHSQATFVVHRFIYSEIVLLQLPSHPLSNLRHENKVSYFLRKIFLNNQHLSFIY